MERPTIEKDPELPRSQDYALLREKGLEYVRDLSGRIWTDHNTHDPGITTLEILCYALTDLGYRIGFDMKDLLTAPPEDGGSPEQGEDRSGLFPAHEILPAAPLTILDYRRLLLKIDRVRNAWLDPTAEQETPLYVDCPEDALSREPADEDGNPRSSVRLTGLYRVLMELEIDDEMGSLNETSLVYRVKRGPLEGVVLSMDAERAVLEALRSHLSEAVVRALAVTVEKATPGEETDARGRFTANVRVRLEGDEEIDLGPLDIGVVEDRPVPGEDPVTVTVRRLEKILEEADERGSPRRDGLLALFWKKQREREKTLGAARCALSANRNLCEDFLEIETVAAERIGVCADISVRSDADLEEVQARAFHAIEKCLAPPVRYYTLKELIDEGRTPDEIFDRPYVPFDFECDGERIFTKPGFIKTQDLEASELPETIHVSDIINVLMDIDGIVSVKNVLLQKYDERGRKIGDSERWRLPVSSGHQPVLLIEKSKLLLFKNEIPYRARTRETDAILDHLRAMDRKAAYVKPGQVLPVPRGRYRGPGDFFSIQHDYPETYGIGEAGLPDSLSLLEVPNDAAATARARRHRLARARQLKGYLTFYDQVLADYLAQLANVRRLFSLHEELGRTYFTRYLTDIAPVAKESFAEEFYISDVPIGEDPLHRLTESEELYHDRRNRILDHLAARFAERFTDYALMLFKSSGDPLRTNRELIADKIEFLVDYPTISRQRYRAFDYRERPAWYTGDEPPDVHPFENVSGLEKRVSRLVGIADYRRRNLACAEHREALFRTRRMGDEHRLEIKDERDVVIFKSRERFPTAEAAQEEARKLYPLLRRKGSWAIDDSGGVGQVFYRFEGGGASLRHDELFETEADAVRSIRSVLERYDQILEEECDDEGFHLIEHILLRPVREDDELMRVCLGPDCALCGDEDPYSFRITVVLPYWPERFRDLDFRRFFERTLREETPAHVHARICWVGNDQMAVLDRRYRSWLYARSAPVPDPVRIRNAQRRLIEILQALESVYPTAELNDCREGEGENLVRLDRTNLGIF